MGNYEMSFYILEGIPTSYSAYEKKDLIYYFTFSKLLSIHKYFQRTLTKCSYCCNKNTK